MKKILFLFISMLLLVSCSDNNNGELIKDTSQIVDEKLDIIEETGEIVEGYVDTLDTSIQDAKAVRDLMNKNTGELQNAINNVVK